ncbi:MAG: 4-hydroxythreonine-4-phosphate dehydrogenase PdxA, partial [Campylobacter sp.]
ALARFLLSFAKASGFSKIGVLGLNPHAGDGGILGREDEKIAKAIKIANKALGARVFSGPLVPDVAFNPLALKRTNRLIAMYHDQALAPLKALYFDSAINVSLALPIIRTSPDHGTAFDIAYKSLANITSYINAVKYAAIQANKKTI